ncbi:MAG: galactokinase family protein, partial [Acidimicrobiia bacterium]
MSDPITVRAPGRVNLIGEHTDYSDGFCLPVAINRECRITAVTTGDRQIRATSAQLPGEVFVDRATGNAGTGSAPWGTFVAGAVATLLDRGHVIDGMQLTINSSVLPGAGLSSSSALAVALTLVLL